MIQPFQITTREKAFNGEGDILVDNFEYLDSPYNHVWIGSDEYEDGFTKTSAVKGWRFRLDNLMFRAEGGRKFLDSPDLFEMGPLYAQIFEP